MLNRYAFRTNINTDERVHRVACQLCKLQKQSGHAVCRWSIDLDDCDCTLRVEAESVTETDIIRILKKAGLQCSVLSG
ncbi:hypothetical protein WBJ53_28280 [Spirosoma sp. SC4-14]|uniref:hypothetical protein n=1 Tax=Spirosoma sp. SC4-14 TaxID=3128900 RepID=UPI0030D0B149